MSPTSYTSSTIPLEPGSALVIYTDGLVERRGEMIDAGMERLARSLAETPGPLEELLAAVTDPANGGASDDDIAILAFRWTPPL